jgi:hypothetical protein
LKLQCCQGLFFGILAKVIMIPVQKRNIHWLSFFLV